MNDALFECVWGFGNWNVEVGILDQAPSGTHNNGAHLTTG